MTVIKHIAMAAIIVVILMGWGPIQAALAADFTVTRTDDPSSRRLPPDDCSLREAVIAANNRGGTRQDPSLQPGVLAHAAYRHGPGISGSPRSRDLDVYDDLTIAGPTGRFRQSPHRCQRRDDG